MTISATCARARTRKQCSVLKDGKDAEFRRWFTDSNRAYASHPGFIRRILLQPRKERGTYVALVEHESHETFMAMHTSETQAELRKRAQTLFHENPQPVFYDVVTE